MCTIYCTVIVKENISKVNCTMIAKEKVSNVYCTAIVKQKVCTVYCTMNVKDKVSNVYCTMNVKDKVSNVYCTMIVETMRVLFGGLSSFSANDLSIMFRKPTPCSHEPTCNLNTHTVSKSVS